MQWAYKGIDQENEAAPIIAEFNYRRRLSQLGYRFDPDDLDAFTADCFMIIAKEIDELEAKEMKSSER